MAVRESEDYKDFSEQSSDEENSIWVLNPEEQLEFDRVVETKTCDHYDRTFSGTEINAYLENLDPEERERLLNESSTEAIASGFALRMSQSDETRWVDQAWIDRLTQNVRFANALVEELDREGSSLQIMLFSDLDDDGNVIVEPNKQPTPRQVLL